jgi:hypothetical protein
MREMSPCSMESKGGVALLIFQLLLRFLGSFSFGSRASTTVDAAAVREISKISSRLSRRIFGSRQEMMSRRVRDLREPLSFHTVLWPWARM